LSSGYTARLWFCYRRILRLWA